MFTKLKQKTLDDSKPKGSFQKADDKASSSTEDGVSGISEW